MKLGLLRTKKHLSGRHLGPSILTPLTIPSPDARSMHMLGKGIKPKRGQQSVEVLKDPRTSQIRPGVSWPHERWKPAVISQKSSAKRLLAGFLSQETSARNPPPANLSQVSQPRVRRQDSSARYPQLIFSSHSVWGPCWSH